MRRTSLCRPLVALALAAPAAALINPKNVSGAAVSTTQTPQTGGAPQPSGPGTGADAAPASLDSWISSERAFALRQTQGGSAAPLSADQVAAVCASEADPDPRKGDERLLNDYAAIARRKSPAGKGALAAAAALRARSARGDGPWLLFASGAAWIQYSAAAEYWSRGRIAIEAEDLSSAQDLLSDPADKAALKAGSIVKAGGALFSKIVDGLAGAGDAQLALIRQRAGPDGALALPGDVPALGYAAFLTAVSARDALSAARASAPPR